VITRFQITKKMKKKKRKEGRKKEELLIKWTIISIFSSCSPTYPRKRVRATIRIEKCKDYQDNQSSSKKSIFE